MIGNISSSFPCRQDSLPSEENRARHRGRRAHGPPSGVTMEACSCRTHPPPNHSRAWPTGRSSRSAPSPELRCGPCRAAPTAPSRTRWQRSARWRRPTAPTAAPSAQRATWRRPRRRRASCAGPTAVSSASTPSPPPPCSTRWPSSGGCPTSLRSSPSTTGTSTTATRSPTPPASAWRPTWLTRSASSTWSGWRAPSWRPRARTRTPGTRWTSGPATPSWRPSSPGAMTSSSAGATSPTTLTTPRAWPLRER